jgi:DNA replication protein DnaC
MISIDASRKSRTDAAPADTTPPARDFDAAIVGGPRGSSALAWVAKKAAAAQGRMDALAAAGKPFAPVYRAASTPADERRRALDAAMGAEWQAMTLDRFNAYSKELRLAAASVAGFIERPRGFLYLHGGVGTGKTHLAAGAAIRLVERGYPVRVYRAADVVTMLHRAVGEKAVEQTMNRLKNVRVLVVDDFGAEHMTEFMAAEWYDLLDYRHRQHAATIVTANLHPDSLNMPRLASRLQHTESAVVVGLAAKDYRSLPSRPAMATRASEYAPPTEMAAECEACGGTGIVKRDLPVAHRWFGRAFPCPRCKGGDR